jgi:hypothetical protein
MKENDHAQWLGMPGCHVMRIAWAIGTGAEKYVVVVRIDVMDLHEPHQVHRVDASGKPPIGLEDVITDGLGAGDPGRAPCTNRVGKYNADFVERGGRGNWR